MPQLSKQIEDKIITCTEFFEWKAGDLSDDLSIGFYFMSKDLDAARRYLTTLGNKLNPDQKCQLSKIFSLLKASARKMAECGFSLLANEVEALATKAAVMLVPGPPAFPEKELADA